MEIPIDWKFVDKSTKEFSFKERKKSKNSERL